MAFTPPRFVDTDKNKSEFYAVLRKRVDGYFKENNISKHATPAMVIKTIVLLALYLGPFAYMMLVPTSIGISLVLWSIMGLALAGVGMSIMHDANHGAYSSNKHVNFWLGHTLNLAGGSVFNWKIQHNVLHHTYTNIVELDDDIDDKLVLRFSPHTKVKWYHKFQVVYAFLFYGILTLYWALLKDFVQYFRYTKQGVKKASAAENAKTFIYIVGGKIFYFGLFFALPIFVFDMPVGPLVLGFLLMQFIAGMVLTTIFQLAHTVEDTTHPLPNADNNIENNWAVHQLCTTVDFSRDNKFISWYIGGLNFQVEHHLFPTICHVHYPEVAKIVEATTKEYGIPYLVNDSFGKALGSHVRTLQRFGKLPELNGALG
jgi:linoleoyl-CoA desaturase